MDLNELAARADNSIRFTPEVYPKLAGKTPQETFAFSLGHLLHHADKSAGKIATMLEKYDHGDHAAFDPHELQVIGAKMLMNAMRFCSLVGMSGDHAGDLVEKLYPYRE